MFTVTLQGHMAYYCFLSRTSSTATTSASAPSPTMLQCCNSLVQSADAMVEPLSQSLKGHHFIFTGANSTHQLHAKLLCLRHPITQTCHLIAQALHLWKINIPYL